MSPASYRAAPPRVGEYNLPQGRGATKSASPDRRWRTSPPPVEERSALVEPGLGVQGGLDRRRQRLLRLAVGREVLDGERGLAVLDGLVRLLERGLQVGARGGVG